MLSAGRLRHRLVLQAPVEVQDVNNGAVTTTWQNLANIWGAIEPLSAREFIASDTIDSEITTRITIRYRANISAKMRLYHAKKNMHYNIEGILADKESGLEYLTLPCSEGLKYT